ncbi:ATP-binding cassette domain-containing protein [Microbacterium aerolatum]|uniref:ABC transporter ATP-binding protein n=1 Tax=Microbacterium aerolatum TaxID=153731 RepID=UPI002001228E|nr:ATP-binding cassette domain-containing protein [Microbacterium aerolatum]MCK3769555.1 ATP-binding cassette domain-containing protein [Microbacterium aerolatum]
MADGQLIEFDHATKRFGAVAAVSDFSARVNPGVVTGFLGPNGAGKTTTLRMLLGLERPTSGTATIGGSRYAELRNPARVIGAMMEDPGFRPRRSVERHLTTAAKAAGIPLSRVGELLSFVGLENDADTRIAALSLGMRQRLSAATALLGDPGVLVLDEPANGLDPEGIRWMRTLIRGLADEGRTVLVSSHVLSEVEQIADEILVIAHGELKFAGTMEDLADPRTGPVVVDAADRSALSVSLKDAGYEFEILRSGLTVRGSDAATIGGITARAGVALTTLQQRGPTLEDVFLDLVHDRYVPPAPVADDTAGSADAERLRLDSLAQPVSSAATSSPSLNDPQEVEDEDGFSPQQVEDAEGASPQQVEDEEGSSPQEPEDADGFSPEKTEDEEGSEESSPQEVDGSDADDVERVEATASEDAAEERPLPGISDLAAVASLFANPVTDPNIAAAGIESAEVQDSESEPAESDAEDLDRTRVIDVVPSFDSEPADHAADVAEGSDDEHGENSDAEQR